MGGVLAYRNHVRAIVEKFGHVQLHEQTWQADVPKSSMPAHLFLCATRHVESSGGVAPGSADRAAWVVREGFFRQGRDISRSNVLFEIAESITLPIGESEHAISAGAAHAALAEDLELARSQSIAASPTLLFNEERQRLTGKVGYRIIEANIRELLEIAPGQLSWCQVLTQFTSERRHASGPTQAGDPYGLPALTILGAIIALVEFVA